MNSQSTLTRRGFLGAAGAAALAASIGRGGRAWAESGNAIATSPHVAQPFRFVHLTDIHVEPELQGGQGFRKCLDAVHALDPRPDFVLSGGDLVFDILSQSEPRAKELFDLYLSIKKDCDIPWHECIGNHDVFGWSSKSKIAPDHASYGKKMVQERLGLERTTYSFDHKGWHLCVVDDIQPLKGQAGYEGGFSEEDLHFLDNDLKAAASAPKILCTHIPVMTVTVFRNAEAKKSDPHLSVSALDMCRNPGAILKLLHQHRVNLVLTGHQHENETLVYEHTTHIEDAAVCGAWWRGPHNGFPEGFGVIDVRADGTFEHQYQTYGWKADAKG